MRAPCPYEQHCGSKAEVIEVRESAASITTEFRCVVCGRTGCESAWKDLAP